MSGRARWDVVPDAAQNRRHRPGRGIAIRAASIARLVTVAALIGRFMVKARWEEQHLSQGYPRYAADARHIPRFVPFWPDT